MISEGNNSYVFVLFVFFLKDLVLSLLINKFTPRQGVLSQIRIFSFPNNF